jgi:pimeloyl-ACP methyl ester carboxylesterase
MKARLETSILRIVLIACMPACSKVEAVKGTGHAPTEEAAKAEVTIPAPVALASSAPQGSGLPPLASDKATIQLPLSGLGPATVEVPVGAREPRPVVVALHGHSVRPEHACTNWRRASRGYAFVLCPHGLPAEAGPNQAVTLGSEIYTMREIDAGLWALRARFGDHVAAGPIVVGGYSLGAKVGVGIVKKHGDRFRRVALGEGGYDELTRTALADCAKVGVERLLLVCSSKACETTFGRVLSHCEAVGLGCRIAPSGENPHMFEGEVAEAAARQWSWLVGGLEAWAGLPEAEPASE